MRSLFLFRSIFFSHTNTNLQKVFAQIHPYHQIKILHMHRYTHIHQYRQTPYSIQRLNSGERRKFMTHEMQNLLHIFRLSCYLNDSSSFVIFVIGFVGSLQIPICVCVCVNVFLFLCENARTRALSLASE